MFAPEIIQAHRLAYQALRCHVRLVRMYERPTSDDPVYLDHLERILARSDKRVARRLENVHLLTDQI
mgnify:CR=1 FL=1